MAVAKWSWETANLSPGETGSAYAMSGATADEVKKAYSTLTAKGAVSDFSYKVWNDMCLKLKDLITEWGTGVTLEDVWVNSPNQSDYPDEETFKKNNGGVITAAAFNRVLAALPDFAEKPWNQKLKAGDPCKASYFLLMAEVLNRWCALTPEGFSTIMEILFKESGNVQFGNTEAIYPEKLDALLKSAVEIYVFNTIFTKIMLEIIATFPNITVETHEPTLIHPNKNEIQPKTSCVVIDKNYVAAETKKLESLFRMAADAAIRNAIRTGITDFFKTAGTVNARSPEISDEMKIRLLVGYESSVKAVQIFPVYTLISDRYKHKSRTIIETHEPVPISIRERFSYSGTVTVGFKNGFNLETEDTIKFEDDFNETGAIGNNFEYEGTFEVQTPLINIQASCGTEFSSEREIQIAGDIDSIVGAAKMIEFSEELGLKGESEVDSAPPQDMQHEGDFGTDETIELSFGNEKELETINETIDLKNGSIELLSENSLPIEHSGSFVTEKVISLGETSTKEISGEQGIETDSTAEISKSMTLEREADVVIEMLSTADIEGILNKNLEAETVSKINSIASLAMQRMSGLASEISFETLQESLIDVVLRKVLRGQVSTSTKQIGETTIKKMEYLSSPENSTSVQNEGIIDKSRPKAVEAKENTATILQSAFLDTSYTKGGTLASDSSVKILQEALIRFANRKILDANTIISTIAHADNEKNEPKQIEGNPIAYSGSEATMVLARIRLVLAEEYEEKSVTEIDDISAEEMERTLLFA